MGALGQEAVLQSQPCQCQLQATIHQLFLQAMVVMAKVVVVAVDHQCHQQILQALQAVAVMATEGMAIAIGMFSSSEVSSLGMSSARSCGVLLREVWMPTAITQCIGTAT